MLITQNLQKIQEVIKKIENSESGKVDIVKSYVRHLRKIVKELKDGNKEEVQHYVTSRSNNYASYNREV